MAHPLFDFTKLTPAQRVDLAVALWDSLPADSEEPPITHAQHAELLRRAENYRRDPKLGASWTEVPRAHRIESTAEVTAFFAVRPEAEADIEEAFQWYEDRSAGLGRRFLDAVESSIELVRTSPQRFPTTYADAALTIRRALVDGFPYGLFFIWDEGADALSVIACMHARRDPRRWLHRA